MLAKINKKANTYKKTTSWGLLLCLLYHPHWPLTSKHFELLSAPEGQLAGISHMTNQSWCNHDTVSGHTLQKKKFNFPPLMWSVTESWFTCAYHTLMSTPTHRHRANSTYLNYHSQFFSPSRTIPAHSPSGKWTVCGTLWSAMILELRHNFISPQDSFDTWIQWGLTVHL